MITCSKCGQDKPETAFYLRKDTGVLRKDCKSCVKARNDAWAAKNPEVSRAYHKVYRATDKAKLAHKAWVAANPEKRKRKANEYCERNRETVRKRSRDWMLANPTKRLEYKLRYEDAKANRIARWDYDLTRFATEEAADLCVRREAATGEAWETDHILPIQGKKVSGLHVWNNLRVIPRRMNRSKSNTFEV